jgi:hypothetical protein
MSAPFLIELPCSTCLSATAPTGLPPGPNISQQFASLASSSSSPIVELTVSSTFVSTSSSPLGSPPGLPFGFSPGSLSISGAGSSSSSPSGQTGVSSAAQPAGETSSGPTAGTGSAKSSSTGAPQNGATAGFIELKNVLFVAFVAWLVTAIRFA